MILTGKTKLDERYDLAEAENIMNLINNDNQILVTLGEAGSDEHSRFGLNLERVVGKIVPQSAVVTEDGQITYDVEIMESYPLSKILMTMLENVDGWSPKFSLSMKGTFEERSTKVEKIICADIGA